MRCGNCKNNHNTVLEVRACYGARASSPYPVRQSVSVGATAAPSPRPEPAPWAPSGLDFSNVPVGKRDERGHYAVELGGDLRFLTVDKPSRGRWQGWVFVKHEVSERQYPVASIRPNGHVTWKAGSLELHVRAVVADPEAAALLYGEKLTRCALCNVRLTDPVSIANRIGPICAGKAGW